jgi:hypothetical protein
LFFEKVNKNDRLLGDLTKMRKAKPQNSKIKSAKG